MQQPGNKLLLGSVILNDGRRQNIVFARQPKPERPSGHAPENDEFVLYEFFGVSLNNGRTFFPQLRDEGNRKVLIQNFLHRDAELFDACIKRLHDDVRYDHAHMVLEIFASIVSWLGVLGPEDGHAADQIITYKDGQVVRTTRQPPMKTGAEMRLISGLRKFSDPTLMAPVHFDVQSLLKAPARQPRLPRKAPILLPPTEPLTAPAVTLAPKAKAKAPQVKPPVPAAKLDVPEAKAPAASKKPRAARTKTVPPEVKVEAPPAAKAARKPRIRKATTATA